MSHIQDSVLKKNTQMLDPNAVSKNLSQTYINKKIKNYQIYENSKATRLQE